MTRAWIALLAAVVAFADEAKPVQVLEDTGFEAGPVESPSDGWWNQAAGTDGVSSEWRKGEGRDGSACVHVASTIEENGVWIWRQHVYDPPTLRLYRLSAWVKAKDVEGNVIVCIRCSDKDGEVVGFGTTQGTCDTSGTADWKEITCEFVPPETTKCLEVLCFLAGTGTCWVDDVTLTAGEKAEAKEPSAPSTPGEDKPGIFRLRGMYEVEAHDRAFEPVVLFPLPLSWGPQVPLSWEVRANPSAMVRSWRVYERKPHDWVAEVRLPSLDKGDRFSLEWEAYVLCGPSAPPALPEGMGIERLKDVPEEVRPWLASTRCVQHKHERFRAMAKDLREGAEDVADLVARVHAKLADIYQHQEGQARDLSALEALDKPGSCTSCANVTAGIYRACGVPARVLAGYPLWSGPLQTHYIVEVWLPETGWYAVESTMLRHPWPQSQQIAVSLVYPEDEDRSAGRACAADGVPYLSLTEAPESDGNFSMKGVIPDHEWCDHEASLARAFAADDAAWDDALALARRHWTAWLAKGADGPVPTETLSACRPLGQAKTLAQVMERIEPLLKK